jgi:hypothetical protein
MRRGFSSATMPQTDGNSRLPAFLRKPPEALSQKSALRAHFKTFSKNQGLGGTETFHLRRLTADGTNHANASIRAGIALAIQPH